MPEPPLLTAETLLAAIVSLSASGSPPTMTEVADANGWPRYTLPDLVRTMARRNVIWKDLAGHLYVGLRKERDSVPHPPSWTPSSPVPQPQDEPKTKRTYGKWPPDEEFVSLVEAAKMEHGSDWAQALTRTLHKSWASIRQHRAKVNKRLQKPSASPAPPDDSEPADVPGTASPTLTLPSQEVGEGVDTTEKVEASGSPTTSAAGMQETESRVHCHWCKGRGFIMWQDADVLCGECDGGTVTPATRRNQEDRDANVKMRSQIGRKQSAEEMSSERTELAEGHEPSPGEVEEMLAEHNSHQDTFHQMMAEQQAADKAAAASLLSRLTVSAERRRPSSSVSVRCVLAAAIDEIPDDAALVRFVKRIVADGTVA